MGYKRAIPFVPIIAVETITPPVIEQIRPEPKPFFPGAHVPFADVTRSWLENIIMACGSPALPCLGLLDPNA